jgi:predicted nucleotidyltransferase
VSLVGEVSALLAGRGIPFALIGAAAMASHGASRASVDVDLLVLAAEVIEPATWRELESKGVQVEIRPGDDDDPLRGVVRLCREGEPPVDVVVGRYSWQREILDRAQAVDYAGDSIPLASMADLILLKLFAGSPQDLWDARQLLLVTEDSATVRREVEERLSVLPEASRRSWASVAADE